MRKISSQIYDFNHLQLERSRKLLKHTFSLSLRIQSCVPSMPNELQYRLRICHWHVGCGVINWSSTRENWHEVMNTKLGSQSHLFTVSSWTEFVTRGYPASFHSRVFSSVYVHHLTQARRSRRSLGIAIGSWRPEAWCLPPPDSTVNERSDAAKRCLRFFPWGCTVLR